MREVEDGGRAAAEENRARFKIVCDEFHLAHERIGVAIDEFAAGGLGKEGAVRAFLRAKGHVNVKALDGHRRFHYERKLADTEPFSESKPKEVGTPRCGVTAREAAGGTAKSSHKYRLTLRR